MTARGFADGELAEVLETREQARPCFARHALPLNWSPHVPTAPLRRTRSALCFLLGGAACLAVIGCGAGKGDVTGKVTFKGEPLKGGYVSFVSESGGPSFTGTINDDGTYLVPNVQAGKYKVCVDTESLKSSSGQGGPGMTPGAKGPGGYAPTSYKPTGGTTDLAKAAETGKIKAGPPPDAKMPEGAYRDGFTTMKENAAKYVPIPLKYAKPETTDITVEVKGGQDFNIELKP